MITKMKCPACQTEFDKLAKLGLCPNYDCRAPLKIVEREDELTGKLVKTAVFRKAKDSVNPEEVEETYTTIYHRDSVKVEKSNKNNYIVTFYKRMSFNWVYCPSCESKMFQNNMVHGSFEHKCHKCKAITTYVFAS